MSDRYLYRAERTDNGEWVEGYYLFCPIQADNKHSVENFIYKHWIVTHNGNPFKVDPSTICQCTGLRDKNGKLIWENDILSIAKSVDVISGNYFYPTIPYPANVKVKWDFCAWMWETIAKKKHYIGFPDAWCHYEAEVIGNIFDNPELLKEGEKHE